MGIFSKFAAVKAEGGVRHIVQWLAAADPKGMSEAEMRVMEGKLDEIGREVVTARNTANKERVEHETIVKLRTTRIGAAEVIKNQIAALPEGSTDRAGKEASLDNLLDLIEAMQDEVEREAQEAKDAQQDLADIESAHAEAVQRFKTARSDLQKAQRGMSTAKRDRARAEQSANTAAIAAGVRQSTSNLTSALDAMRNIAQADKDAAEAARLKAKSLRPDQPEKDDPNIAAAMAAASGQKPAPKSAAERLAALKAA
jgi:uncharacterized phage infection (PIP) family protein YhgE